MANTALEVKKVNFLGGSRLKGQGPYGFMFLNDMKASASPLAFFEGKNQRCSTPRLAVENNDKDSLSGCSALLSGPFSWLKGPHAPTTCSLSALPQKASWAIPKLWNLLSALVLKPIENVFILSWIFWKCIKLDLTNVGSQVASTVFMLTKVCKKKPFKNHRSHSWFTSPPRST